MALALKDWEVEQMVDREVRQLMCSGMFPPDTQRGPIYRKPVEALSISFEITFTHPWFREGTVINVGYTREVYVDPGTNQLENFTLVRGIKFTVPSKDGDQKNDKEY